MAGLDTLFARNPWAEIFEGSGVNHGMDRLPEQPLEARACRNAAPQLPVLQHRTAGTGQGGLGTIPYELAADTPSGHVDIEGRGTAILERRRERWLVVHLHASGRRKTPGD